MGEAGGTGMWGKVGSVGTAAARAPARRSRRRALHACVAGIVKVGVFGACGGRGGRGVGSHIHVCWLGDHRASKRAMGTASEAGGTRQRLAPAPSEGRQAQAGTGAAPPPSHPHPHPSPHPSPPPITTPTPPTQDHGLDGNEDLQQRTLAGLPAGPRPRPQEAQAHLREGGGRRRRAHGMDQPAGRLGGAGGGAVPTALPGAAAPPGTRLAVVIKIGIESDGPGASRGELHLHRQG